MENITETSEASADTTDAENNTNANLSVQDLAASFMEKVEAKPEDNSSTEATEDVTETEVADAGDEQESDVLSQSDTESSESSEESSEETEEDQPKSVQKLLKQVSRLTARSKGAEEEVAALKSQIELLKSQPSKEEKTESKPALEEVQNMKDLDVIKKEAMQAKYWALENVGKDYAELNGVEYDADQIRNILASSDSYLTEKIPERAEFLRQKQGWIQDTIKTFPWSEKGEGAEWELFLQIRNNETYKSVFDSLPNGDYVAATLVEGLNSVKARQEKAKTPPKLQAKTPPPSDPQDAVAPRAESKQVRQKKKREQILGKGNVSVDQFAKYLNT